MTENQTSKWDRFGLVPLAPVATPEPNDHGGTTVWVDWPDALVDRPRTYGIGVGNNVRLAARLVAAINAGVVMYDAHRTTDIHGQTYVAATSRVHGRHLNADLKKLGY